MSARFRARGRRPRGTRRRAGNPPAAPWAGHFLREGEAARDSFGAAWSSKIDDTVDFAFQVAVNRINAAAKAKALATVASITGKIWTPPTTVYAGASTIDLANNTITLGDGTKINTRTGSKVDVSV
jgi:hypothetical protein